MSSVFDPFVLFVSFVVKQFCTSARVLVLGAFFRYLLETTKSLFFAAIFFLR